MEKVVNKKIVQINVACSGSTGRIMKDISNFAEAKGYESYCFYGRGKKELKSDFIKIGNKISVWVHVLITRVFNKHGHGSYFATKKMINQIRKINPDIIHMHNIHGYYINIKVLFKYLKEEYKGKIIWTLHDCWAFTGHCSYFTMIGCNKWTNKCNCCPQIKKYPKSLFFDSSNSEFNLKKKLFSNINNLILITPSNWLKEEVKKSFLKDYTISVVENGIDLNVFKPTLDNLIYEKYDIPQNKKIWLGVANIWEERKGLNIFLELSKMIDDETVIVLVGLSKQQRDLMPNNIIGIERTDNIKDLVKIYTIADLFINPSVEETFSLVTMESIACGTPVVVSKMSATKNLVVKGVGLIVDREIAKDYFDKAKICDKITNKTNLLNHAKEYKIENNLNKYFKLYEE